MTRPTYTPTAIASAIEAWDAVVTDNFNHTADTLINNPVPLAKYANVAALPAFGSFDQCLCVVNEATAGWVIALSNGAAWEIIPKRCATQANSVAGTLGALVTDFNALLAKLKASGVMA